MARILIIGGTGFVGSNLVRYFQRTHSVIIANRSEPPPHVRIEWRQLDITRRAETLKVIGEIEPEIIINAAGNKDVRYCEKHPTEAFRVNAIGTRFIAKAARNVGAKLLYISTDLVFPSKEGAYSEVDIPHSPLVYGRSKAAGEFLAMRETDNLAICRTAGVYGKNSPLLHWLAGEISSEKSVDCFLDVYNTPTFVDNFADMLDSVIKNNLTGLFHTVGRQRVNRYEFFSLFAHAFNFDYTRLNPVRGGDRLAEMLLLPDSSLRSELSASRLGVTPDSPAEGFLKLKSLGGY